LVFEGESIEGIEIILGGMGGGEAIEPRQCRSVRFVIDEVQWKIELSEVSCDRLRVE
jgi:hypothetical protein